MSYVSALLGRLPLTLGLLPEGCLRVSTEQVSVMVVEVLLARVDRRNLAAAASEWHARNLIVAEVPHACEVKLEKSVRVDTHRDETVEAKEVLWGDVVLLGPIKLVVHVKALNKVILNVLLCSFANLDIRVRSCIILLKNCLKRDTAVLSQIKRLKDAKNNLLSENGQWSAERPQKLIVIDAAFAVTIKALEKSRYIRSANVQF